VADALQLRWIDRMSVIACKSPKLWHWVGHFRRSLPRNRTLLFVAPGQRVFPTQICGTQGSVAEVALIFTIVWCASVVLIVIVQHKT
jgi:hypothetical protein